MSLVQLHCSPGVDRLVPSDHCAYVGWGSDEHSSQGIREYRAVFPGYICDVGVPLEVFRSMLRYRRGNRMQATAARTHLYDYIIFFSSIP